MLRLIILFVVGYLLYRGLRSWMVKQMPPANGSGERQPSMPVDDVMVKDPHCGIYFPKRDGIRLEEDGQELFFCSTECKDKYLADRSK